MLSNDLLGYAAACFTTASFVPQAWLTFKTRNVSGISLGMYSAFTFGVALWLVYGLSLNAWPIVAANAVTLALALSILVMRLRYGRAPKPQRWPNNPPSA
ncbi:MAG: SemiSWEET transporter [Hydrogenophaga sp.]|nr:SemiSWEET transporter [Hydrogenophaga sp.]